MAHSNFYKYDEIEERFVDWMNDQDMEWIRIVKEYEEENFGEVTTDLSDPERVVNMYAYIVGEEVVHKWQ